MSNRKRASRLRLHRETVQILSAEELVGIAGHHGYAIVPKSNAWSARYIDQYLCSQVV